MDDIVHMLEDFKNSDKIVFTSLSASPVSDLIESLYDERLDNRNEMVTISTQKHGEERVTKEDSFTIPSLADLKV